MSKYSEIKSNEINLTPSTRKLIQMREGKGMGMLSAEEIRLLRQSAREIAEVVRNARESEIGGGKIANFIGALADKTDKVVSLEEIEKATTIGWAQGGFNREK